MAEQKLTGPMMMLKSMLGVDPREVMEQFKGQVESIGGTVKLFDERMQRMEKMLQFLCHQQSIIDTIAPKLIENGVEQNDQA